MGGVVTHQLQTVKKNNVVQASKGNETKNAYSWWDSAQQATTSFDNDTSVSTNIPFLSTYYYDTSGHLTTVSIQDGRPRTVNYITDSYGQIMNRDEQNQNGNGNPRDIYYYFDGL